MKKVTKPSFGMEGQLNFVNLYTEDNPILIKGDTCYFLLTNTLDIHRPMIAMGEIVHDVFTDGIHKNYYIILKEILEPEYVLKKFLYNNSVLVYQINDGKISISSKVMTLSPSMDRKILDYNCFRIDAFHVRQTFPAMKALLNKYLRIIRNDLSQQIKDIDDTLKQNGLLHDENE